MNKEFILKRRRKYNCLKWYQKHLKEILNHLKQELLTYNDSYGYISHYKYTPKDTFETKTIKETSEAIKTLIKRYKNLFNNKFFIIHVYN